jgi:hypothetical protein
MSQADDDDSPWKDVLEHAFPEFMAFYFPDTPPPDRLDVHTRATQGDPDKSDVARQRIGLAALPFVFGAQECRHQGIMTVEHLDL